MIDKYTGQIKLIDSGTIIKIDQAHLETVLPAIGKQVLILNGAYRGETAILEEINEDEFCAKVSIAFVSIHLEIEMIMLIFSKYRFI